MTLELVNIQHGARRDFTPRLPKIARDPIDDAKDVLAAFGAKQAGQSDVLYADLSEDLAAALRTALAMLTRPAAKPVLRPLALLDVAQAEQFVMELDGRSQEADLPRAMFLLGRLAEHTKALLDVIYATTRMPR